MKIISVLLLSLIANIANAATFNLFSPATGILKGSTSTYVTSAAASSDVLALWTGTCNSASFLRGDGACAAAFTAATGVLVGTSGSPTTTAATSTNIRALWSGTCNSTSYLLGDGSCSAVWAGTTIAATLGGTGQSSYTTGDVLYASSSSALSKLAIGTSAQVVHGGTIPTYSAVSLTADVSGTLLVANGGTGQSSYAAGDTVYASGTTAISKLAAGSSTQVLHSGTTPSWSAVSLSADVTGTLGASSLDQTAAYTWSGLHTWNKVGTPAAPSMLFTSTRPLLEWVDTGATANQGHYFIESQSSQFKIRATDDAGSVNRDILLASKTGSELLTITLGNTTSNQSFSFAGSGAATFGGSITTNGGASNTLLMSNSDPLALWADTDGTTDNKRWGIRASNTSMSFAAWADALGSSANFLSVARGSGVAVGTLTFGNSTDNPAYIFSGSGLTTSTGYVSGGTKFTATGCNNGTTVGGATAGRFASGTSGACNVVITLPTAPNGWACHASDQTTPANLIAQSASSTTSCTITGTTISGDTVSFSATGY